MSKKIDVTLRIWRQNGSNAEGDFELFQMNEVDTAMSFLEMLDVLNAELERQGVAPVAFDHDCREGICGACGAVVNGQAHGPDSETTLCQLHMRRFEDGDIITIEPWRAAGFPIIRDLMVDRTAFDRVMQAGGFITVRTGQAPEAHAIPVSKEEADNAMDAAQCIGCGACVAACPNASAMLFVGAKASHLAYLPQGEPEKHPRVLNMVEQMDKDGFGNCTNHYECEAACPKAISVRHIAKLNRDYLAAAVISK